MSYPDPAHTARRNLAARIERFIAALERTNREPTPYEGERVGAALDLLSRDECRDGEDAMMQAERPDLAAPADLPAGGTPTSTVELRTLIEAVKRDAGL